MPPRWLSPALPRAVQHDPSWEAVQAYDTLKLAAEAIRSLAAERGGDLAPAERRKELPGYFKSHGSALAAKSLTGGGVWLTGERRLLQALRIGRYQEVRLESALVQLVPVPAPSTDRDKAAFPGSVDLGGGSTRAASRPCTRAYTSMKSCG